MNYLELYKEWCIKKYIEDAPEAKGIGGLCNTIIEEVALDLFIPQKEEEEDFYADGVYMDRVWWASDIRYRRDRQKRTLYKFNDVRKNIVLFLATFEGQLD